MVFHCVRQSFDNCLTIVTLYEEFSYLAKQLKYNIKDERSMIVYILNIIFDHSSHFVIIIFVLDSIHYSRYIF